KFATVFSDITERKQAEEEIKRFSRIFEDSINEIFLFNPDSLRFTQVNKAACHNLGYTLAELQEMTPLDIKPEMTAESFAELVAPLRSGEKNQIVFETVHRRKDESLYDTEVYLQLLQFENETLFAAIILDITERKRAEEALLDSEARWQFAVDGSALGLWDWNVQTSEVFFSKQWKAMLGFKEDEISGSLEEWDKRVHPDDKEKVYADINKHLDGKTEFYNNEHRVLCKNNNYKWILDRGKVISRTEDGKPFRMIGTHTDITERRLAEEALRESEEKLRNIFENSTNVIYSHSVEHIVNYISPQIENLLGYTQEEAKKKWTEFASENPINKIGYEHTVKAIETGKSQAVYELEFIHKSGKKVLVEVRESPVVKNGKTVSIVGAFSDITQRKQAEEELSKHREHLEELVKERTKELEEKNKKLEKFNDLFVNREFRIKELKDKVKELEGKNG
ncbi:MAG: PAS domain S-box protein, partial [Candidatus Cloacimonetes bacterium]|nr:PAS domain S-box protein [Candidatus Cloacimonadota bacterium]